MSNNALEGLRGLWAAMQGGARVMRFPPEGHLERVIGLPVPPPTRLPLGGRGRTLYVSKARQARSVESLHHASLAGRLFAIAV